MPEPITVFKGAFFFLSNFSRDSVPIHGRSHRTLEHAFQAAKTLDLRDRERISLAQTPAEAKAIGRKVKLRPDWEGIKDTVMLELLRLKFSPLVHPRLAWRLVDTGERKLVEGNTWGDNYWGADLHTLEGQNKLGILLMQVRGEVSEIAPALSPRT